MLEREAGDDSFLGKINKLVILSRVEVEHQQGKG
jgi:hypothetical protein